ncbi:hypothetical protein ABW20_dc0101381 [Dactylellina cionopaga]|nr:hypothetical protein ABW20_dc0101381 [Dactylellina cionopaga]
MDTGFTLKQVLAVAKVHPFYNPDVEYPPTPGEVLRIASSIHSDDNEEVDLINMPLADKDTLYAHHYSFVLEPASEFFAKGVKLVSLTNRNYN